MAYFKQKFFSGIAPALSARLLPENVGQTAENIDFESGSLTPIKNDSVVATGFSASTSSIYLYEAPDSVNQDFWFEFSDANVMVNPAPLADETLRRVYYSGAAYPKWTDYSLAISAGQTAPDASYRLGVPQPGVIPTVQVTAGSPNADQTPDDVSYVYTLVDDNGQEGAPSPASSPLQKTDTETVRVTIPITSITANSITGKNYRITNGQARIRIYRSNTGTTATAFQFAGEVNWPSTFFDDTVISTGLGELLPSETWIGPPDDDTTLYPSGPLQSMIPLAAGAFCGFTGKRFCISEPYLPHAWPVQYRITLDRDIVAIASTRGGVVALTDGKPIFVTGTQPSAITSITVDFAQACINKDSVVDMGDYVIYAGPDGLCAVEGNEGKVLTKGQISPSQWNADFFPTTMKAFRYEGTYVAFYSDGGSHKGWVFDPRGESSSLSTFTTTDEVISGYVDPRDNELYLLFNTSTPSIYKYRGHSTNRTAKYKSMEYVTSTPVPMGWVSVVTDTYPVYVKVWRDSVQVANYQLTKPNTDLIFSADAGANDTVLQEPIMRLPAGLGQSWEVEVSGDGTIHEYCLAQSIEEIKAV